VPTWECDNMNIKKLLTRKITVKQYHLNFLMISTLFFTLFLITAWPRFREDAMSFPWYFYLILGILFIIPVMKQLRRYSVIKYLKSG